MAVLLAGCQGNGIDESGSETNLSQTFWADAVGTSTVNKAQTTIVTVLADLQESVLAEMAWDTATGAVTWQGPTGEREEWNIDPMTMNTGLLQKANHLAYEHWAAAYRPDGVPYFPECDYLCTTCGCCYTWCNDPDGTVWCCSCVTGGDCAPS